MANIQLLNGAEKIKDSYTKINTSVTNLNNSKMEKSADSDLDMNGRKIDNIGAIRPASPTTLTINNNAITVTQWYHRIDTTDGAGELHTINGGSGGDFLLLHIISNSRPITLKHGVGNIVMPDGLDYTLRNTNEFIELIKYGNVWYCSQPLGVKRSGDRMSGNLDFIGQNRGLTFQLSSGDGETIAELVDFPALSRGNAFVRFFRQTNTTGRKSIQIHKGDGTADFAFRIESGYIDYINGLNVTITAYAGNPNGNVTAPPGSICLNTAGGAGASIYVKESGTGNTGWVAK